jgi:hypothetical protein
MFEKKHQKLAPLSVFIKRLAAHIGAITLLVLCALSLGVAGYHWLADFSWIDSLLNASMILSGMGQIDPLPNDGAKIFASAYALFSGSVVVIVMGILFVPIIHRVLHKFHLEK